MAKIVSNLTAIKVVEKGNTPLAVLAALMQPGEWKKMTPTPTGILNFVGQPPGYAVGDSGHSMIKTGYSDKMAYDPVGKFLYFLGCDHNQYGTFLKYNEATNEWSVLPQYPWAAPTHHGYNHSTFDTKNGFLFHRPYAETSVWKYTGNSWAQINYKDNLGYSSAANGCEFCSDLGRNGHVMIYQNENGTNGALIGIDPITGAVTTYVDQATGLLSGSGDPHNVALYSPLHKTLWFGGGNNSVKMWRAFVKTSENDPGKAYLEVSSCEDIRSELGGIGCSLGQSLAVNNPINGNFLVFKSSSIWFEYNPVKNLWSQKTGTAQVLTGSLNYPSSPYWGTVAAPIHQYGVIVFIKGISATNAEMWVYKPG